MRVLMIPADETAHANPFNTLLNASLRAAGITVESGTRGKGALRKCDVLHVHWPHNFASQASLFQSIRGSILLCGAVLYHKARGAKIAWTVHDDESLVKRHAWLEAMLMNLFTRWVDGLVYFSARGKAIVEGRRPILARKASVIVPHGTYDGVHPPPVAKGDTRAAAGLADRFTLAFLGDVKAYKGVEHVLELSHALGEQAAVVIAGKFADAPYEQGLLRRIAAGEGGDLTVVDHRLSDAELAAWIDASDVVLLPYGKSLNSGMGVLAIERGRRILATDQPSFLDMRDELGGYWVTCVGRWTDPDAFAAMLVGEENEEDRVARKAFLDRRSWGEIAAGYAGLYRKLTGR